MTEGMWIGYTFLTIFGTLASAWAAAYRFDTNRSLWPAFVPLTVWLAPVVLRLWFSLVLS